MAHPYTRRFEWSEPFRDNSLLIGPDRAAKKVKINPDGSIEATKFIDTTDNLELYVDRGEVKARFQVDYSTEAEVSLTGGTSVFRSARGMVLHFNNSLFVYGNFLSLLIVKLFFFKDSLTIETLKSIVFSSGGFHL